MTTQKSVAPPTKKIVEKYVLTFADSTFIPSSVKPHLITAAPIVGIIAEKIENFIPVLIQWYEKVLEILVYLEPYKLEILLPSAAG